MTLNDFYNLVRGDLVKVQAPWQNESFNAEVSSFYGTDGKSTFFANNVKDIYHSHYGEIGVVIDCVFKVPRGHLVERVSVNKIAHGRDALLSMINTVRSKFAQNKLDDSMWTDKDLYLECERLGIL